LTLGRTVLLVEDDQLIASSLERALGVNGFGVVVCGTVAAAIASIEESAPDLVLLDLGLPDGDGSLVATHVARRRPDVPVIVLTARADELDIVLGLEAGAVDYVVKPFRLAELVARIRSHLRLRDAFVTVTEGAADRLVVGDLTVDTAARRVHVGDREVALRPKEFEVLALLARCAGAVVTRERLIDEVWDEHWWGSTKTLDVHINAIRRKLGERAGTPSRIATVRSVGYRLERVAA
jgi:DNA-binding response OmpR family regulator